MPSTPRLFGIAFALVALLALAVRAAAAELPTFAVTLADGRIDPRFFDEFHAETPDMRVIAR